MDYSQDDYQAYLAHNARQAYGQMIPPSMSDQDVADWLHAANPDMYGQATQKWQKFTNPSTMDMIIRGAKNVYEGKGVTGKGGVEPGKEPIEPGFGQTEAAIFGKVAGKANEAIQSGIGDAVSKVGEVAGSAAGNYAAALGTMPAAVSQFVADRANDPLFMMGSPDALQKSAGMLSEKEYMTGIRETANEMLAKRAGSVNEALTGPEASLSEGMPKDAWGMPTTPQGTPDPALIQRSVAAQAVEKNPNLLKSEVPGMAERTKVVQPTAADKLAGQMLSVGNATPTRYTSAWVADPSIASAPTTEQVGREYTAVFDKMGKKIDSDFLKEITGKSYFPNEGQTTQLVKVVDKGLEKVAGAADLAGNKLDPAELFVSRSAAAAAKRSNMYAQNPTFRTYIDQSLDKLDSALEQNGMPEIKDLSAKWFRAKAREAGETIMPLNKNMSPNALRGIGMAHQIGSGLMEMGKGDVLGGGLKALSGVAMSPAVGMKVLAPLMSGEVPGMTGVSTGLTSGEAPAVAHTLSDLYSTHFGKGQKSGK